MMRAAARLHRTRLLAGASAAMVLKEFLQLRRDRVTFATMITIPLMQLMLFGYAINTTPRDLPTAVLMQETSDVGRSILAALREHPLLQGHPPGARRDAEFDQRAGLGQGAVRHRDSGAFRARAAPRRPAGAAGRGRRHRPGRRRLRARRARTSSCRPRSQHDRAIPDGAAGAVRDPRACPLQSGGLDPAQHRARACSARS